MACVLTWRPGNNRAPQADEARRVVMRLSGRQVAYGKDFTTEGLVAGTWVLLALAALTAWAKCQTLAESLFCQSPPRPWRRCHSWSHSACDSDRSSRPFGSRC
jgi:hypothetical protein